MHSEPVELLAIKPQLAHAKRECISPLAPRLHKGSWCVTAEIQEAPFGLLGYSLLRTELELFTWQALRLSLISTWLVCVPTHMYTCKKKARIRNTLASIERPGSQPGGRGLIFRGRGLLPQLHLHNTETAQAQYSPPVHCLVA